MTRHRPFRFLLLLVAALLLATGPGSPLCTGARAADTGAAAMADCMSAPTVPAKKDGLHVHPDCAFPCIGIDAAAPILEPARPERDLQFAAVPPRLKGLRPLPEAEPPRL